MNNWKKCKLGDVAEVVGGGTPSTKESLYWNGDVPWLTPKDLSGYNERYISHGERNISEEGLDNSSAILLPASSVLLTSRAPIGYVAIAKNPIATNQGFKSLVLKKGQDPLFYYYLLKANVEYIQNMGSGSTFKEVSGGVVKELTFLIPEYDEQKRIAEILGSLDDKIELLQKQNKTLEDMAKALFKSWFVDFDVVRAKATLSSPAVISSPYAGEVAVKPMGGKKEEKHHQFYSPSVKALVRTMRQNLTPQEVKLWQHIRKEQLGVKFRRQFPIDSKYIADFACLEKKLIIELDGSQHAENPLDKERTLYLEENGFTVLRFWNNEIDKNLMGCLERIREFLNRPPFGPAGTFPAGGTEYGARAGNFPPSEGSGCQADGGTEQAENGANNTPLPAYGVLSPQGGQSTAQGLVSVSAGGAEQTAWTKERIMREYHLTEELYNLFPSSFVDSPLGPIPSGWEVGKLANIAYILGGFAFKSKDFTVLGIPVIKIKNIRTNHSIDLEDVQYVDENISEKTEKFILSDGDMVMAMTGATIGKFAVLVNKKGMPSLLNQRVAKISPKENFCHWFVYFTLLLNDIEEQVKSNGLGSAQPNISTEGIGNSMIIEPNFSLQKEYSLQVKPYMDKILYNKKQIQTLTELRDSLLPRLISGKIRV